MSSNLRRFHSARVRADQAALCEVQDALEKTRARRAEAQRVLDQVTREAAGLEELEQSLAARLAASRYDSIRLCVAALPDDILRCIFEGACRENGQWHEGRSRTSRRNTTTTPSALAGVCSQWRTVALAFAPLWSTIYVYALPGIRLARLKAYSDYVTAHLSRSSGASLDIVVLWIPPILYRDDAADVSQMLDNIMEALGSQVSRWRTARLFLPDITDDLSTIGCLKGPTPRLTELTLATRIGVLRSDLGAPPGRNFLPHAPVLQSLALRDRGIACCSRSAFPSLTKIQLEKDACTDEDLYDYLIHAPSLVELDIAITIAHAPLSEIALPELQFLKIGSHSRLLIFEPLSNFLRLPKLTCLFLDCVPEDAMAPFFITVSPTVRSLRLSQRLEAQHVATLQQLQNVEELSFSHQTDKTIDGSVLDQLASDDLPIWPRLTTLKEVAFADGIGDHLLGLITARNPPLEHGENESNASGRPCRLREITFRRDEPAPGWFVEEMDRLLRL